MRCVLFLIPLVAGLLAQERPQYTFGRIFAKTYRKSFVLCAAHDYSSHVAACRINNLQLELAKSRLMSPRDFCLTGKMG